MEEISLLGTPITDNIICLKPCYRNEYGLLISHLPDNIHPNYLIETILSKNSKNQSKYVVENSYKQMLKKIHMNLNILGYKTDSSGIDNLEIRIIVENSKIDFDSDCEICTGYILFELINWFVSELYLDPTYGDKFILKKLPRVLTKFNNCPCDITNTYHVRYKSDMAISRYLITHLMYSPKFAKKILKKISQNIDNIVSVNNIVWTEDYNMFTGSFKSEKDILNFNNELIEIYSKNICEYETRENFIKSWFESRMILVIDCSYVPFWLKLQYANNNYELIIGDNKYFKESVINLFKKIFNNLNKVTIINLINIYFKCDGKKIYVDPELINCDNYYIGMTKIRRNAYNMLLKLIELNSLKK